MSPIDIGRLARTDAGLVARMAKVGHYPTNAANQAANQRATRPCIRARNASLPLLAFHLKLCVLPGDVGIDALRVPVIPQLLALLPEREVSGSEIRSLLLPKVLPEQLTPLHHLS